MKQNTESMNRIMVKTKQNKTQMKQKNNIKTKKRIRHLARQRSQTKVPFKNCLNKSNTPRKKRERKLP